MKLSIQQVEISSLLLGTAKVRQLAFNNPWNVILYTGSGSSDQVTSSKEIKNCNVTYVDDIISAMCSYSNGSSVTGFEMIVQLNNIDEVHKLYINGTTEHQSPGPVTVRVEKNGTYQVAIFPIFSDRGVMNTIIAYSRVLSDTGMYINISYLLWVALFSCNTVHNLIYIS